MPLGPIIFLYWSSHRKMDRNLKIITLSKEESIKWLFYAPLLNMKKVYRIPIGCCGDYKNAFASLTSGRPGPVFLELTEDALYGEVTFGDKILAPFQYRCLERPMGALSEVQKAIDLLLWGSKTLNYFWWWRFPKRSVASITKFIFKISYSRYHNCYGHWNNVYES